MPCFVERRSQQVVHRRVDDREIAFLALLHVLDACQQRASITDDGTARLEQNLRARRSQHREQGFGVAVHFGWRLVAVSHAESSADVDMFERDAFGFQHPDQFQHAIERVAERRELGDLRADVHVDACDLQRVAARGQPIQLSCGAKRHTELVVLQSGRDVGMGLRINIGVDPDGDGRALSHLPGDRLDAPQLRCRLDVEAQDLRRQRLADLGARFADTGKHHLARISTGCDHTRQFAPGHDVEAGTEPGQYPKHGEVRIGLERVADQRIATGASVPELLVGVFDRRARVDVARRAHGLCDPRERDAFCGQLAGCVTSKRDHREKAIIEKRDSQRERRDGPSSVSGGGR